MTPRIAGCRVASVAAVALLAGCSSSSPPQAPAAKQGPSLDGIYTIATGPYLEYTTAKTRPVDTYRAAFASTCTDTCVATQTDVDEDNKPIQGTPAMILDFVDGSWRWSGEVEGTCSTDSSTDALPTHYFKSMSLTPQPDGSLTGTLVTLGGSDPCHVANHAPVKMVRIADVGSEVSLPDPAALPAPVESPAAALHGTYDYRYTDRLFAKGPSVTRATVSTYCVRTGTRCATLLLFLNDQTKPASFQVLGYADERWSAKTGAGEEPCAPGPGTDTKAVVTDFPLPKPPADPIATLTGVETTKWEGPCPAERASDIVLNRTGD